VGNKICPWAPEELAALRACATAGATDIEAAAAVALAYTAKTRRTPTACRTKANSLGLAVLWTTRSAALTQGYKAAFGHEDEPQDIKAAREDERFKQAMARAGYTPQEPSRDPGTTSPRVLGPTREGRPSCASGWIV
jgi:hypothetical protein